VYLVTDRSEATRLVQATSQAQALRHVAAGAYTVRAAGALDVVELVRKGVQPEIAGDRADDESDTTEGAAP
jgi:hypothetical protein